MFKKLKDKLAEDLKFSPQRLSQQQPNERNQANNDENFFSIGDDDMTASNTSLSEFTDVSLHASTPTGVGGGGGGRDRKLSTSSMSSDVSFLPRYEPPGNLYHMQSDLDVSEFEDNSSTSSQLGHISKEQVYSAFQKAQMRYHKYRGRYTDLANHYKILERENAKIKTVLGETQDKAIRRVNELKEQCGLEQKAKAHLENALRVELDERQIKIDTLQTKIKYLQQNGGDKEDFNDSSLGDHRQDYTELTKCLNEARVEIENLNRKLQEMKANAIVFNSKETDYKQKISNLERLLQERNAQLSEREKDNNLKLAQSKMELHAEIHNKDLEIANLKKEVEQAKGGNLQTQNAKLIEKLESLTRKCSNHESEMLKLEQYKIEIVNSNEIVVNLKRINEELLQKKLRREDEVIKELEEYKIKCEVSENELEKIKSDLCSVKGENEKLIGEIESVRSANATLQEEIENRKVQYENSIVNVKDDLKQNLLNLESKIKEKFQSEFDEKESGIRKELEEKIKSLSDNEDMENVRMELLKAQDSLKRLESECEEVKSNLSSERVKYKNLEDDHLDLIEESKGVRAELAQTQKECDILGNNLNSLNVTLNSLQEELQSEKDKNAGFNVSLKTKQELIDRLTSSEEKYRDEADLRISDLESLRREFVLIQDVSTRQQNENCRLQEQIGNLQKEIDTREGLNVEVERLSLELSESVGELQKKKEEYSNLEKELRDLSETVEILTREKSTLTESLDKIKQEKSADLLRLTKQVDDLTSRYETGHESVLSENRDLKEKLSKFQDLHLRLERIETFEETTSKDLEAARLQNEQLSEQNKLYSERIDELQAEISLLQSERGKSLEDVAKLSGEISNLQVSLRDVNMQNEILSGKNVEIVEFERRCRQLSEANTELAERNRQLSMDCENSLRENEKHLSDYVEVKMRLDVAENEAEKFKSAILTLQTELDQIKLDQKPYDTLLEEHKQAVIDLNNLKKSHEDIVRLKEDVETQYRELERHYGEITHERQLLKDEIQELKISPLNFKKSDPHHLKEMESLREKLEQYKSIDKTNRSSIEFYEAELQKFKVRNEKLSRKLDDTLVTLPVLRGTHDFGDSQAKLEYLRNILYNYMIGRENVVLAKVITAVCMFDKEQTELIMQKEQQRQTLLGQLFGS